PVRRRGVRLHGQRPVWCPRFSVSARCPRFSVSARCPRFSVSARCAPFSVSVRYSRLGASSGQPKGWTPNGRLLGSRIRFIPSFPVIQNGILAPRLFGKLPSHLSEVFLSAGERPVLPPLHV